MNKYNSTLNKIHNSIHNINERIRKGYGELLYIYEDINVNVSSKFTHNEFANLYVNNINNLNEILSSIDDINPFDYVKDKNGGKISHREKYYFNDRKWSVNQLDAIINDEKMLQRNLFINSELYKDKLGHLIGYEVTIPKLIRHAPIDLIGVDYKNHNLIINLIELKRCSLIITDKDGNEKEKKESSEMLLRAIFEISTYYTWFIHALKSNEDGLATCLVKRIEDVLGIVVTEKEIINSKIVKIIGAPVSIINENEIYEPINLTKEIKLVTIEKSEIYNKIKLVSSKEKLFDLK